MADQSYYNFLPHQYPPPPPPPQQQEHQPINNNPFRHPNPSPLFPCTYYCSLKFHTYQALGGHQKAHRRERAAAHRNQPVGPTPNINLDIISPPAPTTLYRPSPPLPAAASASMVGGGDQGHYIRYQVNPFNLTHCCSSPVDQYIYNYTQDQEFPLPPAPQCYYFITSQGSFGAGGSGSGNPNVYVPTSPPAAAGEDSGFSSSPSSGDHGVNNDSLDLSLHL